MTYTKRRTIRRRDNIIAIYPQDWVIVSLKNLRRWCSSPYPGHKRGCPMWKGRKAKDGTPAPCTRAFRNISTFDDNFDRNEPAWCAFTTWDMVAQEAKIRASHPDWTQKQCRNVRYWQRTFRNGLKDDIREFFRKKQLWGKYGCFDGGFTLNIHATLWRAGLKLERIRDRPDYAIRCTIIAKYIEGSPVWKRQQKLGRQVYFVI